MKLMKNINLNWKQSKLFTILHLYINFLLRKSLEDQTFQLRTKLEEFTQNHYMEIQELRQELQTQQSLSDKYNEKVNHVII